jgi:hypothetical protein
MITIVFTGFNLGSAAIGFATDAGDPIDLRSDRDRRRTRYTNGGISAALPRLFEDIIQEDHASLHGHRARLGPK